MNFIAGRRQHWSDRDGASTAAYIEPDNRLHAIYCLTTVHTAQNELALCPSYIKTVLLQEAGVTSVRFTLTEQRLSLKAQSIWNSL